MDVSRVSATAQDYLKCIWNAREWSSAPVTTKMLADRLGVTRSTVSEAVSRLASADLVSHERYGTIELTSAGTEIAVAMVRRHRLLETFLVSHLGYTWDEVHDEAEVLEHAVSDLLIDRIDAALGHPERDPHGDPIPSAAGRLPQISASVLDDMAVGDKGTVTRISDADPDVLRYLDGAEVTIGAHLVIVERHDYANLIVVRTPGQDSNVSLARSIAAGIWLIPD